MSVYTIDVLADSRWDDFLQSHPRAGVFHTRPWLEALRLTYDYTPLAFTTSGPGKPLQCGLLFCEVTSWITGRRLVSLPFSDHCDLLASADEEEEILEYVRMRVANERLRYAEIRPLSDPARPDEAYWQPSEAFCLHALPLSPTPEELFNALHKDSFQRKVRRAEREELRYEKGRSESLLQTFYHLMLRTRRRHCIPPAPLQWFRSLVRCMDNKLDIRVAYKDTLAVSAILTMSYKDTITYKYGCSDERYNNLGGTPFLFWKTILEAKQEGFRQLDLGRSDITNTGLITFKDRMGAVRERLTYLRCGAGKHRHASQDSPMWLSTVAKEVFPRLPDNVLAASGRFLYRHIG